MRKVLLLGYARMGSHRLQNKMSRPFGNTTLFEMFMRKFDDVFRMENPFSTIVMAIYSGDLWLWKKANEATHLFKVIERDEKSITQGTEKLSEIQHYLKDFEEDLHRMRGVINYENDII